MGRISRHWVAIVLVVLLAVIIASTFALGQNERATVYFANNIKDARYSAVSVRRVGSSTWQYSDYFAPLHYEDTSFAFSLENGDYEYVMSVAQKNYISEIEGTFTIEDGVVGQLTSNAVSGAEIQTNASGETLIIAGDAVKTVSRRANSVFFKVLQLANLSMEQLETGIAFYTERGVKLGIYNYSFDSSKGTISVLLPADIMNGSASQTQTYYTYVVDLTGYAVAKGTVSDLSNSSYSTGYTWTEDPDFRAKAIDNSATQGYQVYLAPAKQGTQTVGFSITSGQENAALVLKNASGETIDPDAVGQYTLAVPESTPAQYFYTITSTHYMTITGSFQIDSTGAVTDLTTEAERQNALVYSYANAAYAIQLIPKVDISELAVNPDGTCTVEFPLDTFEDGWYPGLGKEGRFAIVNDTDDTHTIVGYDVVIQRSNGDYMMDFVLRAANPAVCELYGWSGREDSTLAGLVHVEDKIQEVYGNDSAYCQNYQCTYSDYLLYYYKTKYPAAYASIQSLRELSPAHQYEIFAQHNSTDDCWYDDGPGDRFGNIDPVASMAEGSVYAYSSGAKYGALELDHEVDQLAKAIAFGDGFRYSFDTAITPVANAPSLYEWAWKAETAQRAFQAFAGQARLLPNQTLRLQHLGFQLSGGAFSNCFQVVEWEYKIRLLLQSDQQTPQYHVTYQFVNGTNHGPLPQEVLQLLPTDSQAYLPGATAVAKELAATTVEGETGRWVFQGWDRPLQSNLQGDAVFTGTWLYVAEQQPPTPDDGDTKVPETSDSRRVALWSTVSAGALCALGASLVLRKKLRSG